MVRSTIVVRASDALPLAASVDDEQVGCHSMNLLRCHSSLRAFVTVPLDGANFTRAQAASESVIQAPYTELRAASFHRERSVYPPVCPATIVFYKLCAFNKVLHLVAIL